MKPQNLLLMAIALFVMFSACQKKEMSTEPDQSTTIGVPPEVLPDVGPIGEENIEKVKKLGEIAQSLDITMSQLALAWILRRPEISSAIIGATKPEHVTENVKASDVVLSKDILQQTQEILDTEPEWPLTYKPNYYYKDKMR